MTGDKVPSYVDEEITGQESSFYLDAGSEIGSDGYIFNKTIITHWKKKLNPDVEKGTFLLVGDAMTEWVHLPNPRGSNRKILDHRVNGKRMRSHSIAASIGQVLKDKKPEVAVIMTGLFDVMYPADAPAIGSSVEKIVRECSSYGTIPVLFGLPDMWEQKRNERVEELNSLFLRYSRMYRIPFVDTRRIFKGEKERSFYSAPAVLSVKGKKKLGQILRTLYNKIQIYIVEKG